MARATVEMIPTALMETTRQVKTAEMVPTILKAQIRHKEMISTFPIVNLIQINGKHRWLKLIFSERKLIFVFILLLRLSELAIYCGDNLDDLSACECPPARELLADGTLVCASKSQLGMSPPACPEGCPVCEFCMVLEGCEDIYGL
jgi:hypothetical protein